MSDVVYKVVIEVLTVVLGLLGSLALYQLKSYLSKHNHYKTLQIVDYLTDKAVELTEASYSGASGDLKRKAALDYVTKSLNSRGITASQDEVLAGIEDGCNKLKAIQSNFAPVQPTPSTDDTMVK